MITDGGSRYFIIIMEITSHVSLQCPSLSVPSTSESQPTQILQNALSPASSLTSKKTKSQDGIPVTDSLDQASSNTNSNSSRVPYPTKYDLHGLAETQTQSQYEREMDEQHEISRTKDSLNGERVSTDPLPMSSTSRESWKVVGIMQSCQHSVEQSNVNFGTIIFPFLTN
jgi:hypothetical protein